MNIELNINTCPTYPDKFIRDNTVAPFVLLSIVIVKLSPGNQEAIDSHGTESNMKCEDVIPKNVLCIYSEI